MTRSSRLSRRLFAATMASTAVAAALGRIPNAGALRLTVPWPTHALDPHALDDATALWFGPAIADPLFALDSRAEPYPTLAMDLPEDHGHETWVRLRPDLHSARGRRVTARDAAWSIDRARLSGGRGLLAGVGRPQPKSDDTPVVVFPKTDRSKLARALASPIVAIVPRTFSANAPDGTGAFRAVPSPHRLSLERNPRAARGSAYLDSVTVRKAASLAEALRAFESAEADVGWLGAGLHQRRADAVEFRGPTLGFVVLRTGTAAGRWGAPGVAQQLADALPSAQLRHLGLPASRKRDASAWRGPRSAVLVARESPYLVEVADVVAAALSSPGHEVTVRTRSSAELATAKATGDFELLVDVVRAIGPRPEDSLLALYTADDPRLATHLPRLDTDEPSNMTRSLRLGVIGPLRPLGFHATPFHDVAPWDLGAVWKSRPE